MEISMTEQGIVFLFSCVVGVFLGSFYDVFRILRIAFKPKWIAVFIQDIIFCVLSAVVIIFSIYYTNSGRVRLFGLAGCFLCFVLYHMTVGRFIMFVSKKIIDFINRMLLFLYSITIKPVKIAVMFAIKTLKKQIKFMVGLFRRMKIYFSYAIERKKISDSAGRGFDLYSGPRVSGENIKLINAAQRADNADNMDKKNSPESKRGAKGSGKKTKVESKIKIGGKSKDEKQKSFLR